MTDSFLGFLKKQEVESYPLFDIKRVSPIGVGAQARLAVFPRSEEEFIKIIEFLVKNGERYKIVGKMTNILPSDEIYDGVLIFTAKLNKYFLSENTVYAECGVMFSALLSSLSDNSIAIQCELFGIPGSVGGMIYTNAGAFGGQISDCCESVKIYFPSENRISDISARDMEFSYRKQKFLGTDAVFLGASFRIFKEEREKIKERFSEFIERRRKTQPIGEMSLGSVFKRCEGTPVSLLVDRLGLKGASVGGALVSYKHAGFIVNSGGASSLDIKRLICKIKNEVYSQYGFIPEEEIEYL